MWIDFIGVYSNIFMWGIEDIEYNLYIDDSVMIVFIYEMMIRILIFCVGVVKS